MIQPIVGIRLNNKKFISLLNAAGTDLKSVIVYKDDFEDGEISVYTCKMKTENKIEKIYKIGKISVSEEILDSLCQNEEDKNLDKDVIKIMSSLSEDGKLSITVYAGKGKRFVPVKLYEADIYKEIELQSIQEKETELLDYGDFIKRAPVDSGLLPEEDISKKSMLKEDETQTSSRKKRNARKEKKIKKLEEKNERVNSPELEELAQQAEESATSVAGKILVYVAVVLMLATAGIVYLFSSNYKNHILNKQESFAETVNQQAYYFINQKINDVKNDAAEILKTDDENSIKAFFNSHKDIIAVVNGENKKINTEFIRLAGIEEVKIQYALNATSASARPGFGKSALRNVSHILGRKSAVMYLTAADRTVCAVIFSTDIFDDICLTDSEYTTFVVDKSGCLISGYDPDKVSTNESICNNPLVKMYVSDEKSCSIRTTDEDDCFYGIFEKSDATEIAVMTTVPVKSFASPIEYVSEEALLICIAIFSLTLIFIWCYGQGISRHIKALTAGTEKIKRGCFDLKLKTARRDELGLLVRSFAKMGKALEERENVKKLIGTYADESIIEKFETGELKINGENKFVTVMLIGLQNYNVISRRYRPEEILVILNKYYSFVENVIRKNGGYTAEVSGKNMIVMFGAPSSSGTPKQDAMNAVKAAVNLRLAMVDFNAELDKQNKPAFKICFGINSGTVVTGQLGSENNRAYTCVGDVVMAACAQAELNSLHETNILISKSTANLVSDFVRTEEISDRLFENDEEETVLYSVTEEKKDEE